MQFFDESSNMAKKRQILSQSNIWLIMSRYLKIRFQIPTRSVTNHNIVVSINDMN